MAGSKSKLTLWVDNETKRFGKDWARRHHASLSQMVTDYLRRVREAEKPQPISPVVQKLTRILKGRRLTGGVADYRRYLEKKYLGE